MPTALISTLSTLSSALKQLQKMILNCGMSSVHNNLFQNVKKKGQMKILHWMQALLKICVTSTSLRP